MKKITVMFLSTILSFAFLVSCFSCSEKIVNVPKYTSPTTFNQADPCIVLHSDGYYYYTATYSNFDRLIVRKSKDINSLRTVHEYTIGVANSDWMSGVYSYIWAPELHYIEGTWYMFFTASMDSGRVWSVKNYVAKCDGQDPTSGKWQMLGKVQAVTEEEFNPANDIISIAGDWNMSLDGTVFKAGDQYYYCWAQYVQCSGTEGDANSKFDEISGDSLITINGNDYINGANNSGWSCLFIGKTSPEDFTKVTEATIISIPEYDWEYGMDTSICTHTSANVNVNEGPAVLVRNGKVFIVFSASACDESYCLGMLTANQNADLCDMESWKKNERPVFTTSVANAVYGPGHCSFTKSSDYQWDLIVYHARSYPGLYTQSASSPGGGGAPILSSATKDGLSDPHRSCRVKVFTWNKDGSPNFGEAE